MKAHTRSVVVLCSVCILAKRKLSLLSLWYIVVCYASVVDVGSIVENAQLWDLLLLLWTSKELQSTVKEAHSPLKLKVCVYTSGGVW